MFNLRYKMIRAFDENNAPEFLIMDTEDHSVVETHTDEDEAKEALIFYNT